MTTVVAEMSMSSITEWSPEDIAAHSSFTRCSTTSLTRLGELVGAEGLAAPEVAKFVVGDGQGESIVTDGPTPSSRAVRAA